jgi:hypothetical protein
MNNQNSEKENPSPIYFSPTGDNLPPIEDKNVDKGCDVGRIGATEENTKVLAPLQQALWDYLDSLPEGDIKDRTAKIITALSLPLQNKEGKKLCKYVAVLNIIPNKRKIQQYTGTMEYNEIQEDMANKTNDMVNHPKHYTSHPSGVECIEITRHYCFSIGNAIKYLWRAGLKAEQGMQDRQKEIQDLEKAIWYINDRIKQLKEESSCT